MTVVNSCRVAIGANARTVRSSDVIIIGGGIAGLATAWHLTRSTPTKVLLVEREPLLAAHASGRNAAIFRHLEAPDDALGVWLALRSRASFAELGGERNLLTKSGTLFLGERARLAGLAALAARAALPAETIDGVALARRQPILAGHAAPAGLLVRDDGVIDIHALVTALARQARAAGAEIRTGTAVTRILHRRGQVTGVRLGDGGDLAASAVVIAGGAWAAALGASCAAPLPIASYRRHLVLLAPPMTVTARDPIVWALQPEVYVRPESGALLASPCDEAPSPPGLPPTAADALPLLGTRLQAVAPRLADAAVRRIWACLRSFADDRAFIAGRDPRLGGLYWMAGLGGRGMTCAVALAELLALAIVGGVEPPSVWSPARLLGDGGVSARARAARQPSRPHVPDERRRRARAP